jgi:hypothetical protein
MGGQGGPVVAEVGENGTDAVELYRMAASSLAAARVPFLVGGAYALHNFTPFLRNTKDFDLFVRPKHVGAALDALAAGGFRTELLFRHWLAKAYREDKFVDIIFCSGNGVAVVDDEWFEHAPVANILGLPLLVCPPEEMIWSKAFVLERERYDGADVMHLLRSCARTLDWPRLLRRFAENWRVLYANLILFGFVYPDEVSTIPAWVMKELGKRMAAEQARAQKQGAPAVCRGTLLSREQYLVDVERLGYADARLVDPEVHMSAEDVARWTAAIPDRSPPDARPQPRRRR